MSNDRDTKKYNADTGEWENIRFEDLNPGELFTLYEPDGEVVKTHQDVITFRALGHPYFDKELGTWCIVADPA